MKTPLFKIAFLAMASPCAAVWAADRAPSFTRGESFIRSHPDLRWREQGVAAYEQGRYTSAMINFHRAARYADKPSQAMIAQMLWNGEGGPVDRVMAYVWADLAAERGYPAFIATREKFWSELDPDEQHAAIAQGQHIFDEYGDDVAKPRQERALQRARLAITGSRTGHVGTLKISERLPDGSFESVDGALYYSDKYWKPGQYWKWQDSLFEKLPEGNVEVGPLQALPGRENQ